MEGTVQKQVREYQISLKQFEECIAYLASELKQLRSGALDPRLQQLVEAPPVPSHFNQVHQLCTFPTPPKLPQAEKTPNQNTEGSTSLPVHPSIAMPPPQPPGNGRKKKQSTAKATDASSLRSPKTAELDDEHAALDSFDMGDEGEELFGGEGNFDDYIQMYNGVDPAHNTKLAEDQLFGLMSPDKKKSQSSSQSGIQSKGAEGQTSSDEENRRPNNNPPLPLIKNSSNWKAGGTASLSSPNKGLQGSKDGTKLLKRPLHPHCETNITPNKRNSR